MMGTSLTVSAAKHVLQTLKIEKMFRELQRSKDPSYVFYLGYPRVHSLVAFIKLK